MTSEIQDDLILSALSWYGSQGSPGAFLNIFLAKPHLVWFFVTET